MVTINLSATGAKEAVARLREFLAADGITLKQTHGYEALARTLGYANWNTLQALLNATPPPEGDARQAPAASSGQQMARTDDRPGAEPRAIEQGRKLSLSRNLEQSLHRAIGLASTRHHAQATLEHLLLALTDDPDAVCVFLACHMDMEMLRKGLTGYIDDPLNHPAAGEPGPTKPTTEFQRPVQRAILHVQNSGGGEVTGANVLVALFTERDSHAAQFLQQQGLTRLDVVNAIHASAKPPGGGQRS